MTIHHGFVAGGVVAVAALALACEPAPPRTPDRGPSPPAAVPAVIAPGAGAAASASAPTATGDEPADPNVRVVAVPQQLMTQTARRLAFSPDGRVLASGGTDGALLLIDTATAEVRASLGVQPDEVESMAWSPDGRLLATGPFRLPFVDLWDVHTCRHVRRLVEKKTPGLIKSIAFSPDSKSVYAGGEQGMLRAWDVESGIERFAVSAGGQYVDSLSVSPDGATLAVAFQNTNAVRTFDTVRGKPGPDFTGFKQTVSYVAYSPQGLLAGFCYDPRLVVWDTQSRTVRHALKPAVANDYLNVLAWAHDGSFLATGGMERVHVFGLPGGEEKTFPSGGAVWALSVAPDGTIAAAGYKLPPVFLSHKAEKLRGVRLVDRHARTWSWGPDATMAHVSVYLGGADGAGDSAAGLARTIHRRAANSWTGASRDGSRVGTVARGGSVATIVDGRTGAELQRSTVPVCKGEAFALSQDGNVWARGCHDGNVFVWPADGQSPASSWSISTKSGGAANDLAFDPSGRLLAVADPLRLWDIATKKLVRTSDGQADAPLDGLSFTSDGATILGVAREWVVGWDAKRGATRWKSRLPVVGELAVTATHPAVALAVVVSADGRVFLIDSGTGAIRKELPGQAYRPAIVTFDPSGRFVAVAGRGVRVIRLEDGATVSVDVVQTPTGEGLLTWTDDGLADGSEEALSWMRVRAEGDCLTAPTYPFRAVRRRLQRPGLLDDLLAGRPIADPGGTARDTP